MAGEGGGGGGGGIVPVVGIVSSIRSHKQQEKERKRAQREHEAAQQRQRVRIAADWAARQAARPSWVPAGGPDVLHNLPGTPGAPTTPTTTRQRPQTWADWVLVLGELGLDIWQWIAQAKQSGAAAVDWWSGLDWPVGEDVIYTVSSGLQQGYGIRAQGSSQVANIWSGVGQAVAQIGSGILSSLAMPGGAPIYSTYGQGPMTLPGPGYGTGPVVSGGMARRPTIFLSPAGRPARELGTPLAWSGDLSAVKRLKRAHARIGSVLPHRRAFR